MEQAVAVAHVPNHTINPVTGFIESLGYATAFNSDRKLDFIRLYKANGLSFYRTAEQLKLSMDTVNKAVKNDPAFKRALDDAETEYVDALEAKSRNIALTNDKATLERIFQLKALRPGKYGGVVRDGTTNAITFNVTGDLVMGAIGRAKGAEKAIDAEVSDGELPAPDQFHYQIPQSSTKAHSSTEERTGAASSDGADAGAGAR